MKWIIAANNYPVMEVEANSESEARTVARKEIGRVRRRDRPGDGCCTGAAVAAAEERHRLTVQPVMGPASTFSTVVTRRVQP